MFIYSTSIKSYGNPREMEISNTRSPTVEKNMMDQKLQGGPMKHVREVHLHDFLGGERAKKIPFIFKFKLTVKSLSFTNI